MTTVCGMFTFAGLRCSISTVTDRGLAAPRETVAVIALGPAFSTMFVELTEKVNARRSLSRTSTEAEVPIKPEAAASS